jgi:hypothetical protein
MTTILGEKIPKYSCAICNLNTRNKKDYTKHLLTPKHAFRGIILQAETEMGTNILTNKYVCICGKKYKHHSSLWNHRKVCSKLVEEKPKNCDDELDLIHVLLKENQEFKQLILDQNNKMMELATKPSTVNNINNNQFNLNVFLNEKCKDAMSITDFVDSIEIKSEDLEVFGNQGYIQGISNIFIKGLKDLDETERPLHCSDIKRETLYIKNVDGWDKDDKRDRMKQVIQNIAHKNFKYIPIWKEENEPNVSDVTTKKNDQYMRITNQVMTAITPDDDYGINKIIRNVANKVYINKNN